MTEGSGRGPEIAVGLVVVLGLMALYIVLGGPIPFVPGGGPAIDSVPSEADVVVYADAWSFSETSQGVVDGLLTASNRSLPGYTGPASLGEGFSTLGNTSLDPERLRSVTAFGSYDEQGRVGTYQGMVLKTTWSRSTIITAIGGSDDAYETRTHQGTTVFVDPDRDGIGAAVARLERNQFVIGSPGAVRDAIDAHDGRDGGVNATLERRFRDLRRGPVRFTALVPTLSDDPFVPESITQTAADVETIGGVYYTDSDGVFVELTVGAATTGAADRLEPGARQALAEARVVLPATVDSLLRDASVTRSGTGVRISMSGSAEQFLEGYEALLESGLVNLFLGEPIGEPALEFVPANATAVAYADAGLIADPTTRQVFERVLSDRDDDTVDRIFVGLETVSATDLISMRSVTVYNGGSGSDTGSAIAAILQADWGREAITDALDAADVPYRRESYSGRTLLVVPGNDQSVWISPLGESHLVVGTEPAVRAAVAVSNGDAPSLTGPPRAAMESLPRSYVRVAAIVPESVADTAGPLSGVVSDIEVIGASYDAGERLRGRMDLHFGSPDRARSAAGVISLLLRLSDGNVGDERLGDLLGAVDVTRSGDVVRLSAESDPETILALFDLLPSLPDWTTDFS